MRYLPGIPHPPETFFMGSVLDFSKNPALFAADLANQYGGIVQYRFAHLRFVLVTNPDYVREILVNKADIFIKEERDITILSRFVGRGLVTTNGEQHRQQRKLAQPAFHARRIENYAQTIVEYTAEMAQEWQNQQWKNINDEMMKLTMYIVCKTMFDADKSTMTKVADQISQAMHQLQAVTDRDFNRFIQLPDWIPTADNRQRQQARQVLNNTINQILAQRRATATADGRVTDNGDLLSMLLLAQDENGQFMSDEEVRDQLVTLFVAGHETTSNALSWTWYLLSQHPEVEAKLHEEVDRVLTGRQPTLADLKQLPYTLMVLKEAMRLYPPAWALNGRMATQDTTIGEHHIPKGTVFFISPYAMHHSEALFPNAEKFDPERFAPEREKEMHKYAYLPFGAGPRVCIGNSFAMMEAQLIIAAVAQKFQLRLDPTQKVELNPQVTLSSKESLRMQVHTRPGVAQPTLVDTPAYDLLPVAAD